VPLASHPAPRPLWPGLLRLVIERACNGFKQWRGLATRYDKHAIVYRGGLVLAAVLLWLTDLGDTS
jgi:transposase